LISSSMSKSPITCHVLDSSIGKPAPGVTVQLQKWQNEAFKLIGSGETNSDGRCLTLLPLRGSEDAKKLNTDLHANDLYKIVFQTKPYFQQKGVKSFYPFVEIIFQIENPEEHYHIPLLLSPYSYTTYRGS